MTTFIYGVTDLSTLGNITDADGYLDMPDMRGENITIPMADGTVDVAKYYDERKITFGIAVLGTSLADLETKMNTIRGLFSERTAQTLTITYEDSSIKTALVKMERGLQVRRIQSLARIALEFTMCEPFFRLSTPIADNTTTIDTSPHAMTVSHTGTARESSPTITIDGPFSSITLTNSTTGAVLTYTGAIAAAETVTIGVLNKEIYATLSTGSANVVGNLTHSPKSSLFLLNPGDNTLAITSAGGDNTGTVKVSFYPPFM